MRFDAGGKHRARRSATGIAQHHAPRAGFRVDLAGREGASIGTDRRMASEAMARCGGEQARIGFGVARIYECGESAGTPAYQHDLTPWQTRDGMGASGERKAGEAICSDQRTPVGLADARCADEAHFERKFLCPSTALERDNPSQQRSSRAGEEAPSINLPISR